MRGRGVHERPDPERHDAQRNRARVAVDAAHRLETQEIEDSTSRGNGGATRPTDAGLEAGVAEGAGTA
jgi:hypothetical protein